MAGLLLALLCLYGPLFYTIAEMYRNDTRLPSFFAVSEAVICIMLKCSSSALNFNWPYLLRDLLWITPRRVSVSHCVSDFVLLLCGIYFMLSVNRSISNQLCIPEARTTVILLLSFGFLQLSILWQLHEQLSREMFSHIYLLSISWTPLSMVNSSAWGARRTTPIPGSSKPPSFWSFRVLHWWECLAY